MFASRGVGAAETGPGSVATCTSSRRQEGRLLFVIVLLLEAIAGKGSAADYGGGVYFGDRAGHPAS